MLSKYLQVSNTDECSRGVVIIWLPRFLYLEATPFYTVLFDSEAPEVYIISPGFTPNKLLIFSVA